RCIRPLTENSRSIALLRSKGSNDAHNCRMLPNQGNQNKPGKAGCLGALSLLILPAIGVGYIILNIA
ncbi:hypothetical protein, partial [Desulfobulbus elongatus]|uniref:hypothetical protein n=1 Tax=Desulfobulbus elongatus TaxID=53332 RepID=UPI001B807E29